MNQTFGVFIVFLVKDKYPFCRYHYWRWWNYYLNGLLHHCLYHHHYCHKHLYDNYQNRKHIKSNKLRIILERWKSPFYRKKYIFVHTYLTFCTLSQMLIQASVTSRPWHQHRTFVHLCRMWYKLESFSWIESYSL